MGHRKNLRIRRLLRDLDVSLLVPCMPNLLLMYALSYFRHYLNLVILWSVWYELPNVPCVQVSSFMACAITYSQHSEWTKKWSWEEGVYLVSWMRYQVFIPLLLLQFINIFWYYLMTKILYR